MLTISARNLSERKGVGNTVKKTDLGYRVESNYVVELKDVIILLRVVNFERWYGYKC